MSGPAFAVLPRQVIQDDRLSLECKMTLLAISLHADDNGRGAWPSIETLARYIGRSDRTVRRLLRELEASGHVYTETRFRGSQQLTSIYRLAFDRWGKAVETPPILNTCEADTHVRGGRTPMSPRTRS